MAKIDVTQLKALQKKAEDAELLVGSLEEKIHEEEERLITLYAKFSRGQVLQYMGAVPLRVENIKLIERGKTFKIKYVLTSQYARFHFSEGDVLKKLASGEWTKDMPVLKSCPKHIQFASFRIVKAEKQRNGSDLSLCVGISKKSKLGVLMEVHFYHSVVKRYDFSLHYNDNRHESTLKWYEANGLDNNTQNVKIIKIYPDSSDLLGDLVGM